MATIYMHIGTPKTGTTALQNLLANNEKALNKQGYSYPFLSKGMLPVFKNRNGHFLAMAEDEEQKVNTALGGSCREKCFQIIGEAAEKFPNIVLSDEILWHRCNKKDFWPNLLEDIKKINCQLKVIVYLRRQDEIIQSMWNQMVKSKDFFTMTFDEALNEDHFRYFPMNYYAHLTKIASFIGKENLIVRVYEKGQFEGKNNDLITDFLENLGLDLTEDFEIVNKINPGLSGNFLEMKRMINQLPQYKGMDNFMVFPMLNSCMFQDSIEKSPKISMFTYEGLKEFMAQYEESNIRVAKEYLGREDGVMYKAPIAELPVYKVNDETMQRDMLIYTAEMFCSQERKIRRLQDEIQKMKKEVEDVRNSAIYKMYKKVTNTFKK